MRATPRLHGLLRVFVYGTLKRGFENHERYLGGARRIRPAWVHGRLHLWAEGIPILAVPSECVLFTGSRDAAHDLTIAPDAPSPRSPDRAEAWRRVEGELVEADGALARLGVLDALEGFHPRAPGHYARVLLPVHLQDGTTLAAWAYVAPEDRAPDGPLLGRDRW